MAGQTAPQGQTPSGQQFPRQETPQGQGPNQTTPRQGPQGRSQDGQNLERQTPPGATTFTARRRSTAPDRVPAALRESIARFSGSPLRLPRRLPDMLQVAPGHSWPNAERG